MRSDDVMMCLQITENRKAVNMRVRNNDVDVDDDVVDEEIMSNKLYLFNSKLQHRKLQSRAHELLTRIPFVLRAGELPCSASSHF